MADCYKQAFLAYSATLYELARTSSSFMRRQGRTDRNALHEAAQAPTYRDIAKILMLERRLTSRPGRHDDQARRTPARRQSKAKATTATVVYRRPLVFISCMLQAFRPDHLIERIWELAPSQGHPIAHAFGAYRSCHETFPIAEWFAERGCRVRLRQISPPSSSAHANGQHPRG